MQFVVGSKQHRGVEKAGPPSGSGVADAEAIPKSDLVIPGRNILLRSNS
jgi:hypothetical protein